MSWAVRLFQGNPPFIRIWQGKLVRRIAGHRLDVRAVPVHDGIGANTAVVAQEAEHSEHPPCRLVAPDAMIARLHQVVGIEALHHRLAEGLVGIDATRHPAPVAWKRDLESTIHGHGGLSSRSEDA
jgi:hypothetical protein